MRKLLVRKFFDFLRTASLICFRPLVLDRIVVLRT